MTRTHSIGVFALAVLICPSGSYAQPRAAVPAAATFAPTIDSIARAAISSGRITGLAIGVSRNGRSVYASGFGTSAAPSRSPVRASDVFRIASITKQFTAVAIQQLVDQNRLSLDDRVSRWITTWPADRTPVTIRQLLTHTAGIREVRFAGTARRPVLTAARTRRDTITAFIVADSGDFAPGSSFRYSNAGYFLLGQIVERASGMSLADYWRRRIFIPLGMRKSSDCDQVPAGAVVVRGDERDSAGRATPTTPVRMEDVYAAGALCSTVGDLLTWRVALESGRVISRRLLAQMNDSSATRGIGPAYGFGVFLGALSNHPWIAHNGSINGFATRLASYPRDSTVVVVLANTGGVDVTPLERAIARAAIGLPDPARAPVPLSEAEARRFAGTYEDREHGLVATIRANGTTVVGTLWQLGTTTLLHQGGGVFVLASDHDFRVTFRGDGAVADRMDVSDGVQGTTLRRR